MRCLTLVFGKIEEETLWRPNKNATRANPHKEMTLPSTQNLKALGLWVFFLICCSTFSFLFDVGLKLTLGYLTISSSSESPSSTLIHYHSSGSIFKHEYHTHKRSSLVTCLPEVSAKKTFNTGIQLYSSELVPPFTHLNGTRLPETSARKTFDTAIQLYSSEPVTTTNHRL